MTANPSSGSRRLSLLGWVGGQAAGELGRVVALLKRELEEPVRREAVLALARIDPGGAVTAPLLGDIDREVCDRVLDALEAVGDATLPLRQALRPLRSSAAAASPAATPPPRSPAGGGPAAPLPPGGQHPDGLEKPNGVWWKGRRATLQLKPFLLLKALWGQDTMSVEDVKDAVWGHDHDEEPGAVKSALFKVNQCLISLGVPFRFGLKSGLFLRRDL